jgi:hypothetical protein
VCLGDIANTSDIRGSAMRSVHQGSQYESDVDNESYCSARTLARRVRRPLEQSSYGALRALVCDVDAALGTIRLSGRVPSHYLKQLALAVVSEVAGDRSIVNEIQVIRAPRRPSGGGETGHERTIGGGWTHVGRDAGWETAQTSGHDPSYRHVASRSDITH